MYKTKGFYTHWNIVKVRRNIEGLMNAAADRSALHH